MGFFFDERYAREFVLFGWLHILVLVLGAGSLFGLYYLRRYLENPTVAKIFRYTVATLLFAGEIGFHAWQAWLGHFDWVGVIPLGLCDMMNWITLVALFFDLKGVIKVVLPWAFVGALLSFVVVDMGVAYTVPHFRFFHYFGNHWLFLIGNLYYLFARRFTYDYKSLLRSTAWLAGLCVVILGIDLAIDANNMFLVKWPEELDFINQAFPFPLNTLLLVAGIFILFNLFYLIFVIKRFDGRTTKTPADVLPIASS
jgi:hypothetical integral membrane protein (TIGR02206 family)